MPRACSASIFEALVSYSDAFFSREPVFHPRIKSEGMLRLKRYSSVGGVGSLVPWLLKRMGRSKGRQRKAAFGE